MKKGEHSSLMLEPTRLDPELLQAHKTSEHFAPTTVFLPTRLIDVIFLFSQQLYNRQRTMVIHPKLMETRG